MQAYGRARPRIAGHASIGAEDYAYHGARLDPFLPGLPEVAGSNTDSFVALVYCLAGDASACAVPGPRGDTGTLDGDELRQAQEGLAWLEFWLQAAEQDTSGLYVTMHDAWTAGRWTMTFYRDRVLPLLAERFGLERPFGALPTTREKTMVASIWHRYRSMREVVSRKLDLRRADSPGEAVLWEGGTGAGPGERVSFTPVYVGLDSSRKRVEVLLPAVIAAIPGISEPLRAAYEDFARDTVRENWDDRP